jgi:hypothetical protein
VIIISYLPVASGEQLQTNIFFPRYNAAPGWDYTFMKPEISVLINATTNFFIWERNQHLDKHFVFVLQSVIAKKPNWERLCLSSKW